MSTFVSLADSTSRTSEVWQYFWLSTNKEVGQCQLCYAHIAVKGSCTKGMISHLKARHKISFSGKKTASTMASGTRPSLAQMLSEQVAVYGLTFKTLAKNLPMHEAFTKLGYKIPTSAGHIRNIVIDHHQELIDVVKKEIDLRKKNNERFSITFDETTTNNRRYAI